jgi:hypothetical protein
MSTWVIQSNLIDPVQISQIVDACNGQGLPYVGVQVLPFIEDIKFLTEEPTHEFCIPYGSTKLVRLAQERKWKGMFFDHEKFRVDVWNANRSDMLNDDAEVMLVAELRNKVESIADDEVYFIRPVEDLKAFNGTVTTAKEIRHWMSSVDSGNFSFDENTPVIVAQPKKILAEWRWFIVGGKIISGSTYRMHGQRLVQRETDPDVINEAQELADGWLPHDVCVMDVAVIEGSPLPKVIEFNCFNSSGFYYHDIGAIVKAATKYTDWS